MGLTITKIFSFHAAHQLPHHKGDCGHLHGHTYKLEVTVRDTTGYIKDGKTYTKHSEEDYHSSKGMVMDFSMLKRNVEAYVLSRLDHSFLNNHVDNPTAENLILYIYNLLKGNMGQKIRIVKLRLWETESSYAEFIPEE